MALNDVVKKTLGRQMCLLFGPRDTFAVKWGKTGPIGREKKDSPFKVPGGNVWAQLKLLRRGFYHLKKKNNNKVASPGASKKFLRF